MRRDLVSAVRMVARERGFAAMVVLTLAVGIGANTAIFSVVNSVLLRPLEYKEPDRLVAMFEVVPRFAKLYPMLPVNLSHHYDWRKQAKSFESMAIAMSTRMNLTGVGEPALLRGARVSAKTLDVLGIAPRLGRGFTEPEDREGQDRVVILSDELWKQRFHSDPAIVGREIIL